jgi:nitroreductase
MTQEASRRHFLGMATILGAGLATGGMSLAASVDAQGLTPGDMNLFEVLRTRRSVRKFKSTRIPDEHVNHILEAARMAPTAGNQQPWKFLVVRDRAKLDELRIECLASRTARYREEGLSEDQMADKMSKAGEYFDGFLTAPVHIIVLTDSNSEWPTYNEKDGTLAAGHLLLAARALGYGSVFATDSISEEVTKKVFRIPDNYIRICYIPIGVPEEWPETPPKRDLGEFIVRDTF